MMELWVNSLIFKITLLFVFALAIDRLWSRRHILEVASCWNAVLLSLITIPLAICFVPKWNVAILPQQTAQEQIQAGPAAREIPDSPAIAEHVPLAPLRNANHNRMPLAKALVPAIYGAGVLLLLIRLLASFRLIRELKLRATAVPHPAWQERLDYWSVRLGLTTDRLATTNRPNRQNHSHVSGVRLLVSDQIDVPMALGILQPMILIPTRLVPRMTHETLDAILTHELAHIVRRDCAWQLLQRIIEAAVWFHPLSWMAWRRMEFVRERACDEFAVHQMGDFHTYAETLLEIAAGTNRGVSQKLGLAMARSMGLARRLDALGEEKLGGHCLASTKFRLLVTAGILFAVVGLSRIAVHPAVADDSPSAAKGTSSSEVANNPVSPAASTVKSPELIAVTWQQIREHNNQRIKQPVWRPDGTLFSDEEAAALSAQTDGLQAHWWNRETDLRPLVFVFRPDSKVNAGPMTILLLQDGTRVLSGSWGGSSNSGLCKSAISPARTTLAEWPETINVEIKIPLEQPTLTMTVDSITDERVTVAPGVLWYIDNEKGVDYSNPKQPRGGLTAAVFELQNDTFKSLTNYSFKMYLKGSDEPSSYAFATVIEPQPGKRSTIYVSRALDDPQSIERVEFFRQRFRFEQINTIKTRPDLLPSDRQEATTP